LIVNFHDLILFCLNSQCFYLVSSYLLRKASLSISAQIRAAAAMRVAAPTVRE